MAARNDDGGPVVRAEVIMDSLEEVRQPENPELHSDQRAAVANVLLSGNRLDAIVGPAGAGKTTAMGAVKEIWEAEYGGGSVIGLARRPQVLTCWAADSPWPRRMSQSGCTSPWAAARVQELAASSTSRRHC